ncbi:transposase [Mycobacteroides abscessus subsp. abscessus]|nr:transposase [Mycobacteroides abscessus subsp. abscessus]SHY74607.1 transposase [Mycobacteroides abscessus subsp. abscessus]SIE40893.1 transposase [Mycobacteroides abscessus subsp. abscessus]
MKTVPTIRVADTADAVVLPDLPEEIALAMTDIAGAAREGLLAMSVAAGMAVMQALFEAEIAEVAGPKGKHDPNRAAVRHGSGRGSVTLGGRRVAVDRRGAHAGWARGAAGQLQPLRCRGRADAGGDGADAGRGGHPPACAGRRAGRHRGRQGGEID